MNESASLALLLAHTHTHAHTCRRLLLLLRMAHDPYGTLINFYCIHPTHAHTITTCTQLPPGTTRNYATHKRQRQQTIKTPAERSNRLHSLPTTTTIISIRLARRPPPYTVRHRQRLVSTRTWAPRPLQLPPRPPQQPSRTTLYSKDFTLRSPGEHTSSSSSSIPFHLISHPMPAYYHHLYLASSGWSTYACSLSQKVTSRRIASHPSS